MWRSFGIPASEEVIRSAVEAALPKVLEVTGKSKTGLSNELFKDPSALKRFLGGTQRFKRDRILILIEFFYQTLGVDETEGGRLTHCPNCGQELPK